MDFPGLVAQMVKNPPIFQIPELGRSHGEGNGNPLQYSCLENPIEAEPGGLQSMGSQISGLASYQVPCDFNVLIS